MNTGKISADYHLYKKELDTLKTVCIRQEEEIVKLKHEKLVWDDQKLISQARIAELEQIIKEQGRRTITAIDNAKATAAHMLKLAEEKEKVLNPALLESEREANEKLTERIAELEENLDIKREEVIALETELNCQIDRAVVLSERIADLEKDYSILYQNWYSLNAARHDVLSLCEEFEKYCEESNNFDGATMINRIRKYYGQNA